MTTDQTTQTPAAAAAAADFGQPGARRTGRNPQWPYVPVILDPNVRSGQRQLLGVAFATRDEAVAYAEGHILRLRHDLAGKLAQPRYRALRRQYGVDA